MLARQSGVPSLIAGALLLCACSSDPEPKPADNAPQEAPRRQITRSVSPDASRVQLLDGGVGRVTTAVLAKLERGPIEDGWQFGIAPVTTGSAVAMPVAFVLQNCSASPAEADPELLKGPFVSVRDSEGREVPYLRAMPQTELGPGITVDPGGMLVGPALALEKSYLFDNPGFYSIRWGRSGTLTMRLTRRVWPKELVEAWRGVEAVLPDKGRRWVIALDRAPGADEGEPVMTLGVRCFVQGLQDIRTAEVAFFRGEPGAKDVALNGDWTDRLVGRNDQGPVVVRVTRHFDEVWPAWKAVMPVALGMDQN